MKQKYILLVVLLAALSCVLSAFAEEVHFTCGSDPADFSGRIFDDLYLDVEGCGNNLEFTDISVKGSLVYNGGTDVQDHSITFVDKGGLWIESMFMPCESIHNCHFGFITDPEFGQSTYVAREVNIFPSGKEKGKITIESPEDGFYSAVMRLNYIADVDFDHYKNSLKNAENAENAPDLFWSAAAPDGEIGLEIKGNVEIDEFSVINPTKTVKPVLNVSNNVFIDFISAFGYSLNLSCASSKNHIPAFLGGVDGDTFDLSLDGINLTLAHFFGYNNPESVLRINAGFGAQGDAHGVIDNLFLFGSNMEFVGAKSPVRSRIDIARLIITEQPENYSTEPSPAFLNDYLDRYAEGYAAPGNHSRYAESLDLDVWNTNHPIYMLMTELSEKYARDYPASGTHWKPYVELSNANILKAICAKSIADEVPPRSMFRFVTGSYMAFRWNEVWRYVMPEGITESLAQVVTSALNLPLDTRYTEEGCHIYQTNGVDLIGIDGELLSERNN